MQAELNNLLWLARRKVPYESAISNICGFLDNHFDYNLNQNNIILIIEIFRLLSQNKIKNEKSFINDFLEKITKKLIIYFKSTDQEDKMTELVEITMNSREEVFHNVSITFILFIMENPQKYKNFLNSIDDTFRQNLLELNATECKKIQALLKKIAFNNVDFCLNFVSKSLHDIKKLKLIGLLFQSLQEQSIEEFIFSLEDPKYSNAFVFILNELPEELRKIAMNFIIQNIEKIELNIFAKKLSCDSISMKLFVENQNTPIVQIINVLLKVNANFECFKFFSFDFILDSNDDSNPVLQLFYIILSKQRTKIYLDLANKLFEKFEGDDDLFRFYRILISEGLFLYLTKSDEKFNTFIEKLLDNLLTCCTMASVDLYSAFTMMHEGEEQKKYIENLFNVFLNTDKENAEEFITNSLLQIFFQNQKSFIISIRCMNDFYNLIFPEDSIQNYEHFSKFAYLLEKYFKQSESIYPISDFGFVPHNKALLEGKIKIVIGTKNYEFLCNKTDRVDSLLKRMSFVFGMDLKSSQQYMKSAQLNSLEKIFKSSAFIMQQDNLPPPAFFSKETKLSSNLLLNFANPKVDEKTSKNIANILEYMPDDPNFIVSMKSSSIPVFTHKFYVRYLVLFDNVNMAMGIIKNFINYFSTLDGNDNKLKMEILTSMKKNLKMIASVNGIDFNKLFDSFFDMLNSPKDLKQSYSNFLQYIMDNISNQLIAYFEKKKKLNVVDPPAFLFTTLLRLFKMANLDEIKYVKPNKKTDFGSFLVKQIIQTIQLDMNDFRKVFKLLKLRNPIDTAFYINFCQQLVSTNIYENVIKKLPFKQQSVVFKKDMMTILKSLPYNQNENVRNNVLNVFSFYSKSDKFKQIIYSTISEYMRCIESTNFYVEPYDFSFDQKSYEKSPLGIRLKASPTNSPLNAVIQNLLNLEPFINEKELISFFTQKVDYKKYYDPSSLPSFKCYEDFTNPVDIIRGIDIHHHIQFEDEFPDLMKPVCVIENISNLTDIQKDIVKCDRTFKFKGLIATTLNDNKYFAIVLKDGRLIKFLDVLNEEIQTIPKSDDFEIKCVFYCEQKEIVKTQQDTELKITNIRKNKRILFCFSSDFQKIIRTLKNFELTFVYYVNFAIRMKDTNISNEFTKILQELEMPENFCKEFIHVYPQIFNNMINIADSYVVENFRKTVVKLVLEKIPDNRIIEISRLIFNSINIREFIEGNAAKISKVLSLFTDYLKSKKPYFKTIHEDNDIITLLNDMCVNCLTISDGNFEYYSNLDMHSIFECLKFFFSSISKQKVQKDIFQTFPCFDLLEKKHSFIIKNKINIAAYIFLIQTVYGKDQDYMTVFYAKLFFDDQESIESQMKKDDYFLFNLFEIPEEKEWILLLFNYYFSGRKLTDSSYLFSQIEEFIKKNAAFMPKFVSLLPLVSDFFEDFSFKFIPIVDQMIAMTKEEDLLKKVLNDMDNKIKEKGLSIIDFNIYVNLLKSLNYQTKLNFLVEKMKENDRKENDSFCLFFGDFLLSCKAEIIQPSFVFDIILYKLNDIRVDFTLFFLKKFIGVLSKSFFMNPKMRELYIFCIIHNQVNPLTIDDYFVSLYNLFTDIRNQTSKKMILNNPPSDRFITIMKIVKSKVTAKNTVPIKTLDRYPFNFIENSEQHLNVGGFSETISLLFNRITNMETINIDLKILTALIENILSNKVISHLELNIADQNKLFEIVKNGDENDGFKNLLLDLMIFSQLRDVNAFNKLNVNLAGFSYLNEKMFFFLTTKTLYGNDMSLIPFLMRNIENFAMSVLHILNEPILNMMPDKLGLMQRIKNEMGQNHYNDFQSNFENVVNIITNYFSNQSSL